MLTDLNTIRADELMNAATTAMALLTGDGIIIQTNEAFTHLIPVCEVNTHICEAIAPIGKSGEIDQLHEGIKSSNDSITIDLTKSSRSIIHLDLRSLNNADGNIYLCSATKEYLKDDSYFLQQLINTIPESIFIKDLESRFLLANNWVAQVMNVETPQDLIGKNDFDFHPEQMAQRYFDDEQDIIQSGKPIINKQEKVLVGGKTHWYSTTKVPFYDKEGRIRGVMGIGRDVTSMVKKTKALKRAKTEAEKADMLKSTFLANLSHEIRTPLNGIIGFSQFLKQKKIDISRQDKYLNIIHNNGQQLLLLINDIIDISMIDSNQLSIKKNLFRVNPVIDQLKANFEHLIQERNLHLEIKVSKAFQEGSDKIYTDDFRLNQILNNLVVNAIKFTQKGSIELGYEPKEQEIEFYVKDTGIGIAPDAQKEIFIRFRQVDESATRSYGGTGLGLSICKGLVELLGGNISVESEQGKGSTFYFTLPYINQIPSE